MLRQDIPVVFAATNVASFDRPTGLQADCPRVRTATARRTDVQTSTLEWRTSPHRQFHLPIRSSGNVVAQNVDPDAPRPRKSAISALPAVAVASEVAIVAVVKIQIDRLRAVVDSHLGRHRDPEIYTSLPGLGCDARSRILGVFGDGPDRDADARAPKNHAGTSPSPTPGRPEGRLVGARSYLDRGPLRHPRFRHTLRGKPPCQRPVLQSDGTPIAGGSLITAETVQFSSASVGAPPPQPAITPPVCVCCTTVGFSTASARDLFRLEG